MVFKVKTGLFIPSVIPGQGGGTLHKANTNIVVPDDFYIDPNDPDIEIVEPPKDDNFNTKIPDHYKKMIEKDTALTSQMPNQIMKEQQSQMVKLLSQVNELTRTMLKLTEDNKQLKQQMASTKLRR